MIELKGTSATASAHFEVSGEEPVVLEDYTHAGKKILPEQVYVRWELGDGGVWQLEKVRVSGPVLKADGTTGKTVSTRHAFRSGYQRTGVWTTDAPAWLRNAVNAQTPRCVGGN